MRRPACHPWATDRPGAAGPGQPGCGRPARGMRRRRPVRAWRRRWGSSPGLRRGAAVTGGVTRLCGCRWAMRSGRVSVVIPRSRRVPRGLGGPGRCPGDLYSPSLLTREQNRPCSPESTGRDHAHNPPRPAQPPTTASAHRPPSPQLSGTPPLPPAPQKRHRPVALHHEAVSLAVSSELAPQWGRGSELPGRGGGAALPFAA